MLVGKCQTKTSEINMQNNIAQSNTVIFFIVLKAFFYEELFLITHTNG